MSAQQLRVWRNFIVAGEVVRREVGRELWENAQLSEADFTVLAELAAAPAETMRSTQCARALDWDTGRFSHQVRRMEQRGLVSRGRGLAGDGRAAVLTLTDAGRTAYRQALGPHLRSARRWFLDALAPGQLDQLDDALATVLDHLATTTDVRGRPSGDRTPGEPTAGERAAGGRATPNSSRPPAAEQA